MSRLGVIRWNSHPAFKNFSSSNQSLSTLSMFAADEWFQADVIIITCITTVLVLHMHFRRPNHIGMSTIYALASIVVTLLLAPLVGATLLVFALYRQIVSLLLRTMVKSSFRGLLHGTDAFWAIEEDETRSIINVLALADFSFIVAATSPDGHEPLQTITELIQDRILTNPSPSFSKLSCLRQQSCLGYFYWEKRDSINIPQHIRWMDIEDQGDQTITEKSLQNFVSSVMNLPLPCNHKAGWEILVGRYPIQPSSDLFDAMENGGWITKSCVGIRYPVLFRVHHSIGDGVALVNLLLDSLGDPCSQSSTPMMNLRSPTPSFDKNFFRRASIQEEPGESVIASWHESDIPKRARSFSADFQGISVDIPQPCTFLKRSNTLCFDDSQFVYYKNQKINDFGTNFKAVCTKVLKFINDTKNFKDKCDEKSIECFNIKVNDRPSEEFINLINDVKNLESQAFIQDLKQQNTKKQVEVFLRKSKNWLCILISFVLKVIDCFKALVKQWSVLLLAPAALLNQALLQTQDANLLHGPKLSGYKVAAWYFEQQDNSDQLLMSMIKRIRSKTGVRFSDVLLTALSASLESFFAHGNEIPPFVTVVIPARIGGSLDTKASTNVIKSSNSFTKVTKISSSSEIELENKFSVAMLPLPVANPSKTNLKLFSQLRNVRKHCDVLRNSPDYLINYWLLGVVSTLIPSWFLRFFLKSTHSTLVMSNLPGPTRLTKLAGHTLHDLVFWVPNRTTTGIGVSVLSYAGRLQLGLMADRALVASQEDAQLILDNIATAIQQMDQISSPV